MRIELGDSGGYETTGYASALWSSNSTTTTHTAGFFIQNTTGTGQFHMTNGLMILTRGTTANNIWYMNFNGYNASSAHHIVGSGYKSLSGTLDRVRLRSGSFLDFGNAVLTYA